MQPKTSRGRKTRERIVDSAARLIHVHGVRGTSVDDVLAASSTGKSQFYHYFDSKEGLIRAVLDRHRQTVLVLQGPLLQRLDSFAGIAAWFDEVIRIHRESDCIGGCPIGSMAAEMADEDPFLRRGLAEVLAIWRDHLEAGLVAMKARGELRSDADPAALARFVVAVKQGGILLAKTEKDITPLENAFAHALAYLRSFAVEPS